VVYLGIDQTRFRPQLVPASIRARYRLPDDRRYLLYVGSEDPRKNLSTLVSGLAEVRKEAPDVALIKVGRAHFEAERQRLQLQAAQLGLHEAIHFLDDVPEDDLPLLYNLADVCVMPSLYEGFGFPALEALACGTAVVCSTAPSLCELVGAAARQHESRSPHELAEQIIAALAADDQAARAEQGRMRAAGFTWQRTVEQSRQAYQRAVDGHAQRRPARGNP
jgi:glycosyltransferase involved in cell wall biosynthesis